MEWLNLLLSNRTVVIPFILWFAVQTFKILTDLIRYKKFDVKRIMGAGGMPSSHSAVVCSVATCIGFEYGIDSGIFALAVAFAFIVMYDAAGVRRAAGKQARILNKILQTPGLSKVEIQEKLTEALGHTPIQVIVGALVGIIVPVLVYTL